MLDLLFPSASQEADVVRLFQKLLEDKETEEVSREFIVPERRQKRLRWLLPSRSTNSIRHLIRSHKTRAQATGNLGGADRDT
jgi:hypothetical protein